METGQQKRSKILLVSVILSIVWMIFCTSTFSSTVNSGMESSNSGEQLGTMIGAALLVPYMVVAWIGTLFNFLGWIFSKRGFALTAGILMSVSLVIGITWGFGLIPSIILSFVAYAKMKKA